MVRKGLCWEEEAEGRKQEVSRSVREWLRRSRDEEDLNQEEEIPVTQ